MKVNKLIAETVDAVAHHFRAGTINWAMVVFLSLAHAAAVWGICLIILSAVETKTLLWALFLWPVSGLGITAGAHRLWSHRSCEFDMFDMFDRCLLTN